MPIEKVTPGELHEEGLTYAVVPSETIELLHGNGEAVAILTYLLNKSEEWIIREKEVMRATGFGRRSYRKGMRKLRAAGLLYDVATRNESGQFSIKTLTICALATDQPHVPEPVPMDKPHVPEAVLMESPHVPETVSTVCPPSGECTPLPITDYLPITDITESPDGDFQPEETCADFVDSSFSEETPPSEEKTYYDQGVFLNRCMSAGISPSLDDLKYLNSRNWVVDGKQLTLDAYIQERQS